MRAGSTIREEVGTMPNCIDVVDPRTLPDPTDRPQVPEWLEKCGEGLRRTVEKLRAADVAYETWKEMQRGRIGPLIPDDPICPRILPALTVRLQSCGPEFYERCDFDDLIRICPFDPAWDAFEWKLLAQKEKLDALQVRVEALEPKQPKSR
jgi:hypothetical protein